MTAMLRGIELSFVGRPVRGGDLCQLDPIDGVPRLSGGTGFLIEELQLPGESCPASARRGTRTALASTCTAAATPSPARCSARDPWRASRGACRRQMIFSLGSLAGPGPPTALVSGNNGAGPAVGFVTRRGGLRRSPPQHPAAGNMRRSGPVGACPINNADSPAAPVSYSAGARRATAVVTRCRAHVRAPEPTQRWTGAARRSRRRR